MKKKHSILLVYCIYVLGLFGLAVHYQILDELARGSNFATSFGKRLGYFFQFFALAFLISWCFLVIIYFICKRLSFPFIFLAPVVLFLTGILVFLAADFILWITQLRPGFSDYHELFFLASVSTTILMVWMFGDVFHNPDRNLQKT